jgi:hypothetical protein
MEDPQTVQLLCGYVLSLGMCLHSSSLAQKNYFTYEATPLAAVPLLPLVSH